MLKPNPVFIKDSPELAASAVMAIIGFRFWSY